MSFRTDVLGNEVGVLAKAVAGAFDLDDDGVVQEPIEQRRGDDGIEPPRVARRVFGSTGQATVRMASPAS